MSTEIWGGLQSYKAYKKMLHDASLDELQGLLNKVTDILILSLGKHTFANSKASFVMILEELDRRARKEIQEGQHDNTGA